MGTVLTLAKTISTGYHHTWGKTKTRPNTIKQANMQIFCDEVGGIMSSRSLMGGILPRVVWQAGGILARVVRQAGGKGG